MTITISSRGDLFRKMNPAQRQALFNNTARSVGGVARHIQERQIANCTKADPAYGAGVAEALARIGWTFRLGVTPQRPSSRRAQLGDMPWLA